MFYFLWPNTQNTESSAPASSVSEERVCVTIHYLRTLGGGCAQPVGHSLRVRLIGKAQLDMRWRDGVLCVTGTRPGGAVLWGERKKTYVSLLVKNITHLGHRCQALAHGPNLACSLIIFGPRCSIKALLRVEQNTLLNCDWTEGHYYE